jgi:hypothetical protein
MKKDTFYFSHDYNAATNVKILFLRQQLGMEGYGIYWFLIEQLANSGGLLPLKIVPVLAMQMQTSEVKVSGVIQNFDLFIIENGSFFSQRLNQHLEKRNALMAINSEKGKKSAEIKAKNQLLLNSGSTAVEQGLNNGSTKERKVNKKKGKKIEINPRSFYDLQIELNKNELNIEQYKKFVNILFGENETLRPLKVVELKGQVSYNNFLSLNEDREKLQSEGKNVSFTKALLKLENRPSTLKDYTDLFLTLKNYITYE